MSLFIDRDKHRPINDGFDAGEVFSPGFQDAYCAAIWFYGWSTVEWFTL